MSINCSAVCHYSGPVLYLCDADGSTVWASRLFKWSVWEDSESKRWFLVHVHSDGIERKWLSPLMQMFFLKDNPNLNIDATIVSSKGSIFFSLTILEGLCKRSYEAGGTCFRTTTQKIPPGMSSTRTAATSLTPIPPPPWCWSCFATW